MAKPTSWKPGQSGNPNGRPAKGEAWSDLLRSFGNKALKDTDGKRRAAKRIISRVAVELATMGSAQLPSGKKIEVNGDAWFDVVKWLFDRIDGKPQASVDVTGVTIYDGLTEDERMARLDALHDRIRARRDRQADNPDDTDGQ